VHPYELVLQASSPDGVFKELLTIASNGSTKLQAMYIFPYIMWVRMCSTSGFPELTETSRTGCTQPFAPLLP